MSDKHYLRLLSESYPTAAQVRSRIIRLKAVLSLPKGTEYFFSDLHGEYRAFIHLLNSASGVIHDTIDTLFSVTLTEDEREVVVGTRDGLIIVWSIEWGVWRGREA